MVGTAVVVKTQISIRAKEVCFGTSWIISIAVQCLSMSKAFWLSEELEDSL